MIFVETLDAQSSPAAATSSHGQSNPEQIGQLVESLSVLHDTPKAALELIACGQDAIFLQAGAQRHL
jgi:hypothetical protein